MILNEETKHAIIGGLLIMFFCLFVGATVLLFSTTRELNKARRSNDELTERVSAAENTNRELTKSLGQIRFLCDNFDESVDRNIRTVGEAIEVIEELREEVWQMESIVNMFDIDGYYDWLDSYVYDSEVEHEN